MKTCIRLALLLCLASPVEGQTQAPPKDAKIYEVGKDGLKIDGKLTKDEPPLVNVPVAELKGAPHQVFHVKLHKGQHYIIDLVSKDFDAFLILLDAAGKRLAYDDDSGGGLNSRIAFSASSDGVVRWREVSRSETPPGRNRRSRDWDCNRPFEPRAGQESRPGNQGSEAARQRLASTFFLRENALQ